MTSRHLIIIACLGNFAFAAQAWSADVDVNVTTNANPPPAYTLTVTGGPLTAGDTVTVTNKTDGPIKVTITVGHDDVRINQEVAAASGGAVSAEVYFSGVGSACTIPAAGGDEVCALLPIAHPGPAVSEWGMMILTLVLLTAVTVVVSRRRRSAAA